jgi:hypothetical protein
MAAKIDPKAFYLVAVPFVEGELGGKSYRRGQRVLGADKNVQLDPGKFVLETEASGEALDRAFSDHWNRQMGDPARQAERNARALAAAKAVGTRPLPGDDMVTASAKKIVAGSPETFELAIDEKGQVTGARFSRKAIERGQGMPAAVKTVPIRLTGED